MYIIRTHSDGYICPPPARHSGNAANGSLPLSLCTHRRSPGDSCCRHPIPCCHCTPRAPCHHPSPRPRADCAPDRYHTKTHPWQRHAPLPDGPDFSSRHLPGPHTPVPLRSLSPAAFSPLRALFCLAATCLRRPEAPLLRLPILPILLLPRSCPWQPCSTCPPPAP